MPAAPGGVQAVCRRPVDQRCWGAGKNGDLKSATFEEVVQVLKQIEVEEEREVRACRGSAGVQNIRQEDCRHCSEAAGRLL